MPNVTTLRTPDSVRGAATVRTEFTCYLTAALRARIERSANLEFRIPNPGQVPVENLLARPEHDAGARLNVFERLTEIAEPMPHAHDVRVHDERHHTRRFLGVGVELLELIDRTVAIFRRLVVLNQHHRDVVALLRIGDADE